MSSGIVLSVNGRDGLESAAAAQAQTQARRNLELIVGHREISVR